MSRFTIHSFALWLTLNHSKCIPLSLLHFGLFFPYVDWARILHLYLQPQYLYKYIFLNSHIEIWNSHAWREIWREIFFFFSLIQSCTQILLPNSVFFFSFSFSDEPCSMLHNCTHSFAYRSSWLLLFGLIFLFIFLLELSLKFVMGVSFVFSFLICLSAKL